MRGSQWKKCLLAASLLLSGLSLMPLRPALAADHGDAPLAGHDQACDIADVYAFLDPNDNTKLVIIGTFRGFIAAGENVNFGQFDPNVRYRFLIENTDDAEPDGFIDVRFSPKVSSTVAQNATIKILNDDPFTVPTTISSLSATAPDQVVTTVNGVDVFAGMVDDPFFFDIPAFSRFRKSFDEGHPDTSVLDRGRDSFAGYNVLSVALRMPVSKLKGSGDTIGVALSAQRRAQQKNKNGTFQLSGKWRQIDRMGNPAVNVVLIPFALKNAYNQGTPQQDANGKFLPKILDTLDVFGTDDTSKGILGAVAIQKGDYVRLDPTIANTGNNGGKNPEAGFPNGRRLDDDVVDTLIFVVNNRQQLGDNVNHSDILPQNSFPFLAKPQQPREGGASNAEDNTRN
jgi:hypothetical protein